MRQRRVCPKCAGRVFYVVEQTKMSDGRSANGTIPVALAAQYMPTGKGLFGDTYSRVEAQLDAWICAGCAYSELYARDLRVLEQLRVAGAEGVSLVDARPGSDGAFR